MKLVLEQIEGRHQSLHADIMKSLSDLTKEAERIAITISRGGDCDDGHWLVAVSGRLDRLLSRAMDLRQTKSAIATFGGADDKN